MKLEFRIASNATDDKAPTEFWAIGLKRKDALTALEDVEYIMNLEKKVSTLTEAERIVRAAWGDIDPSTFTYSPLQVAELQEGFLKAMQELADKHRTQVETLTEAIKIALAAVKEEKP